jgi:hypothetical protein
VKITFGRFAGQDLEDLPTSYLEWICENIEGRAELVKEAETQLTLRRGEGVVRKETR